MGKMSWIDICVCMCVHVCAACVYGRGGEGVECERKGLYGRGHGTLSTEAGGRTRRQGASGCAGAGEQSHALSAITATSMVTDKTLKNPTCLSACRDGKKVSGITAATARQPSTSVSQPSSGRPSAKLATSGDRSWRSRIWLAMSVRKVVKTTANIVVAWAHLPHATRRTWSYVRSPPCRRAALRR